MSAEVFVCREDDSPRLTLDQLQSEFSHAGVACRIAQQPDRPWLVLDGCETDMSITVNADGIATSAMVHATIHRTCSIDSLQHSKNWDGSSTATTNDSSSVYVVTLRMP